MQAPRKPKHLRWLLVVVIFGAGAIWALGPRGTDGKGQESDGTSSSAASSGGADVEVSRLRQAMEVLSRAHDDPGAFERRVALSDLLTQGDAPTRLTMILEAAAADPTPQEQDPLWPELVQGLSTIWHGEGITSGMDLMFTESRPRARHAVVSSFAKLASDRPDQLTPVQRQKLTEYFIDVHKQLPAAQQREIETATRKIAGNDVADLMQGKGMTSDDELEVQREYKRTLEEGKHAMAQQQQQAQQAATPPP